MKRSTRYLSTLLAIGTAIAISSLSAKAITYTDLQTFSPALFFGPGTTGLDVFNGTFNILAQGYDPSLEQVISATATFRVRDNNDAGPEEVTISLGGAAFDSSSSFSNGAITLGGAVLGSVLLDLSANGLLAYTITRTQGDFFVDWANLTATAEYRSTPGGDNPSSVPDGGTTAALLGLAMLGMIGASRKWKR
jgi:hypothetical protein